MGQITEQKIVWLPSTVVESTGRARRRNGERIEGGFGITDTLVSEFLFEEAKVTLEVFLMALAVVNSGGTYVVETVVAISVC